MNKVVKVGQGSQVQQPDEKSSIWKKLFTFNEKNGIIILVLLGIVTFGSYYTPPAYSVLATKCYIYLTLTILAYLFVIFTRWSYNRWYVLIFWFPLCVFILFLILTKGLGDLGVGDIELTTGVVIYTIAALIPLSVAVIIYSNKDALYLDRIKLVVFILNAVFLVPTILVNIYAANITDMDSMPNTWNVTQDQLTSFGLSPREYWRVVVTALSMPFVLSLACIRALVEGIAFYQKTHPKPE